MHAVVVHTLIDPDRIDEAIGGIGAVKTRLRGLPGFEHAIWFEPIDGHGLMVSIWANEQDAAAAAPPVGFSPAPGVIVERVEMRRVLDQGYLRAVEQG